MTGKAGSKTFKYISFDISKDNDKITLDQTYHINNIKPIPISNQEKCNDSESAHYCQLVENQTELLIKTDLTLLLMFVFLVQLRKHLKWTGCNKDKKSSTQTKELPHVITFPEL